MDYVDSRQDAELCLITDGNRRRTLACKVREMKARKLRIATDPPSDLPGSGRIMRIRTNIHLLALKARPNAGLR